MNKRKEPNELPPGINRRDLLALASAAGAVGVPLSAAISMGASHAALAQPQIEGGEIP